MEEIVHFVRASRIQLYGLALYDISLIRPGAQLVNELSKNVQRMFSAFLPFNPCHSFEQTQLSHSLQVSYLYCLYLYMPSTTFSH